MNNKLLLKTAFACMACDGEVDPKETDYILDMVRKNKKFNEIDVKLELQKYAEELNRSNKSFFDTLFSEIRDACLSQEDELLLISFAIKIIEADEVIEYREIKFFKLIRSYLKVSDNVILENFPGKEDYIAEDIKEDNYYESYFSSLENTIINISSEME